jgi:16S rRNA processing protein RimM
VRVEPRRIPLGRVRGHRGRTGEITVVVWVGEAAFWVGLGRVILEGPQRAVTAYRVERARAYRDRLVLKLAEIDDATRAARLRGALVQATAAEAREAAGERFHPALFFGLRAIDEGGTVLGRITEVVPTAGPALLSIEPESGGSEPVLLPAVPDLVGPIDEVAGTTRVRPPRGLLGLTRGEGADE